MALGREPSEQTLEVRHLHERQWMITQSFGGDDAARAQPFDAMELPLGRMWL